MRVLCTRHPMASDATTNSPDDMKVVVELAPSAFSPSADYISEIVESVWREATEIHNERCRDDERKIKNYVDASCTLKDLIDAIDGARRKSGGSGRAWKGKLDDALERFSKFAPAIDVFIQQQPNITSIVWGSFRLVLRVSATNSGLGAEVENGMVLILTNIGTWHQIIKTEPRVKEILEICSLLFSHVLTFLVEARIYCEAPQLVQYWKANVESTPEAIGGTVEAIHGLSTTLLGHAQIIAESRATQHRHISTKYFHSQTEENAHQAEFRNESHVFYQRTADALVESAQQSKLHRKEEHRRRKVEKAIQMISPEHQVPINIPERAQDTCDWITDHEVFMKWDKCSCRHALWIKGPPGCGKSVMARYLRDRSTCLAQPTFAHFFSLNTEKASADKRSLALSIILQILQKGIDARLSGFLQVVERIASICLQFDNSNQLSFFTLKSLIQDAFKELKQYTLIIDGLDECEQSGKPVIDLIDALMKGSLEPRPRIILLSRNSDKLTKTCAGTVSIAMDERAVTPDIERYITLKVHEYPVLEPLHEKILRKVRENCHGHFLWAHTMIEDLRAPAKHAEARLKRLQSLPDNLMEIYERLVNRTAKGRTNWELRLRREILLLLLNPKRALTVDEVGIALQFRSKIRQDAKQRFDDIDETITQLCWPLVTILKGRAILVHTLVEDFLTQSAQSTGESSLSIHITRAESDATLARRCLNVLSEEKNRDPNRISYWLYKNVYCGYPIAANEAKIQEDESREIVLYPYAARYWSDHLTSVVYPSPDLPDLLELAANFLHNFEFVMYGEYFYDLKYGEIGPISEVQARLRSWWTLLPKELKEQLNLDDFYQNPYSKLTKEYTKIDGSKVLRYLCLFRLGDFYTLQAKSELRYKTYKEVAEGLQAVLGSEDPLVLRAKYMFVACLTPRREYEEALELATKISELQKTICGLEKNDYWKTLQLIADVQYYMTDFEEANDTQAKVSKGWTGVTTVKRFNVQISDMMSGHIFEARGLLEDALIKYELVEQTQRKFLGDENVVTLYAQVSMASVCRKQKRPQGARDYLDPALASRQMLYGEKDKSVVDTTIQIIILDREEGSESSFDAAQARIDMLKGNGSLHEKYERYCQVEHLQALIYYDQGQPVNACKALRTLLHEQAEKGRKANNRSLLWVRLTLATILRELGKGDEAASLFLDIVTSVVHEDISPQFVRVETIEELKIAEEALRHVRDRRQQEAEELLREYDLRWVRKADFWMLEGIPSVDTAWMKGP